MLVTSSNLISSSCTGEHFSWSMSSNIMGQPWKNLALYLVYFLSPLDKGLSLRLGKAVVPELDLFAL